MFLTRHQILLLVAFAGAVLANIVPVLMTFDELDVLRAHTQRINDAAGAARKANSIEVELPRVVRNLLAVPGLELAERAAASPGIELGIANMSRALMALPAAHRGTLTAGQAAVIEEMPDRLQRAWQQVLALRSDTRIPEQAKFARDLLAVTDRTRDALADLSLTASKKTDTLSKQVYEHLALTAALLLGAITVGFCINGFGSLGIFRALSREQDANADLAKTKLSLRERTQELSEAQRLGKLGGWRFFAGGREVLLGAETVELLRLEPTFAPTPENLIALVLPESQAVLQQLQVSISTSGEPLIADIKLRRGDGSVGDFTLTSKVQTGGDGQPASLVGTLQDISERKAAEEQLRAIAFYDPLTGLANRALFTRELGSALARPDAEGCALLLLDLDRFKEVNDTLGHAAGDELLMRVAHVIARVLGPQHFLARLGGDEFAIILRKVADEAPVVRLASEIVQKLSGSFLLKQGEVTIGTSIGIVIAPRDGRDTSDLMRNADLALYKAKEEGRGRYAVFTPALDVAVQNKMALANDLRRAIATNTGLDVHFQPQYDLRNGTVEGFEALMRWTHATRGEVAPCEFIPVAESSSLICDIGNWVLRQSVRQARAWLDEGAPPRSVSVNVSPAQIWHADFVSEVADVLDEFKLPPHLLCLELTESLMADHGEGRVRRALKALKALGVTLALDDFGTDYSSLGYLAQLPFDKIKIDRIFVHGIHTSHRSRELLRGMIALGRGLGMDVIAEGAECQEEVDVLHGLHCDLVQGFVFGKALPAGEAFQAANARTLRLPVPQDRDETDASVAKLRSALA